jgi:hypothetical protein
MDIPIECVPRVGVALTLPLGLEALFKPRLSTESESTCHPDACRLPVCGRFPSTKTVSGT